METLQSYLKNYFGFSETQIKTILDKTVTRNLNSITNRIEFYLTTFNIPKQKLSKMIIHQPKLLELDTNSESQTSVKTKIKFYQNLFGVDDKIISNIIQKFPALLGYDTITDGPKSIKGKCNFYKSYLNINEKEFQKMLRKAPQILSLDTCSDKPTSVKSKLNFYKNALKLTDAEVNKIAVAMPSILGYDTVSDSPKSVKSKLEFYKQTFDINEEQLAKMIKLMPTMLCLDTISDKPTSFKSKIQLFDSLGINRKIIVERPLLLSTPANSLKIRIMLKAIYYGLTSSFANGLMMNEKKVYARAMHLKANPTLPKRLLYDNSKKFQTKTKTNDEALTTKYILTREKAKNVELNYNQITNNNYNLTQEELAQYPSESEIEN